MDFSNYKIKLNVKTCCLYEQMTGKSFMEVSDGDDVLHLMYASLVVNNPDLFMTYNVFLTLIEDPKILKWIERSYKELSDYSQQINFKVSEEYVEETSGDTKKTTLTMTDIATTLIMEFKVDPHYVMYEMELWEVSHFFETADKLTKKDMLEKRFWTYLQILPQIDGKKIKSPRQLLPFEWEEKDIKKQAMKEMENNMVAIKANIGRKLEL